MTEQQIKRALNDALKTFQFDTGLGLAAITDGDFEYEREMLEQFIKHAAVEIAQRQQ